ncbi:MAG TPA: O-antigen ligase family protein [Gemmatimonadaceae bacterium]|nr:O-antigen ligase family protein [Gemmatimonadaceae bacterium]
MRFSRGALPEITWRNAIIVLLLMSLLVPLIVGSGFFFPYVVPRNIYFRVVVELGVSALVLAVCFSGKTIDLRGEPIFWALLAFVAASFVSALFSPARMHSLFGDFERMGGVWAWLHLLLFFLLLRTLRDEDWSWILNGVVVVSVIIGVYAIIEHGQLVAAHWSDGLVAPSSATLGNAGLMAAYLLVAMGVALYLASNNRSYRLLYTAAALVGLVALIYAQNRSAFVGLVLGAVVGGVIYSMCAVASRYRLVVPAIGLSLGIAIVGGVVMLRQSPNSALGRIMPDVVYRLTLTNPRENGDNREMQWRAAWEGFQDRPLTGWGPENHNLAWSAHFDPRIYAIDTDVFDRTHNEFLEVIATGGLIGIVAFAAVWVAIAMTLGRAYRCGRLTPAALGILSGLQVSYAVYLFFWFFDLNSTMLWILIAALIASRGTVGSIVLEPTTSDIHVPVRKPAVAAAVLAVLVAALVWEGYVPLRADRALARIDSSQGSIASTAAQYELLSRSRAHQTAHTPMVMAQYLGALRPRLNEIEREPEERADVERAIQQSLDAFTSEIRRDPLNDRLYTHYAGLLAFAADFYDSPEYRRQAINALHKAIDLSPHRIEQWMALANLYLNDRDYERAIVVLNDAVKSDPMLGEPRYRLANAYLGAGKGDSALVMLQSSLRHGYVGSPETYLAIGKRLEFSGRSGSAAKLYSDYLEAKYTEAVWDGSEQIDKPIPSADLAVAAHLPLLYVRTRERDLAIKSAAALSAFDPTRAAIVDRFVSDLGARRRRNWVARASLLPCNNVRASRLVDSTAVDACGVFRRKL